ncbi:MAG TPA: tripartite tricarboxylate transporter TctB family protein, partial [Alicycliphilus sp.]|nr:tripartite tricarboxylate transporter TctB family protein [Alicycliphilus sp.]
KGVVVETVDGEKVGKWAWKQIFFIIASNLLFGVLLAGLPSFGIPAMGLIVAIYGLTFVAALAGSQFRFKEVLLLATILAVGSYAAFIWGLNLQFPVWPSFIAG